MTIQNQTDRFNCFLYFARERTKISREKNRQFQMLRVLCHSKARCLPPQFRKKKNRQCQMLRVLCHSKAKCLPPQFRHFGWSWLLPWCDFFLKKTNVSVYLYVYDTNPKFRYSKTKFTTKLNNFTTKINLLLNLPLKKRRY